MVDFLHFYSVCFRRCAVRGRRDVVYLLWAQFDALSCYVISEQMSTSHFLELAQLVEIFLTVIGLLYNDVGIVSPVYIELTAIEGLHSLVSVHLGMELLSDCEV